MLLSYYNIFLSEGRTALHNAAYLGHTSIVKYLLEKGADMEKPDENGDLPIHLASRMGCHGYVAYTSQLLLIHSVNYGPMTRSL